MYVQNDLNVLYNVKNKTIIGLKFTQILRK